MSNKEIIKQEEITLHLLVWKYTKYVYIKNMGGGGLYEDKKCFVQNTCKKNQEFRGKTKCDMNI